MTTHDIHFDSDLCPIISVRLIDDSDDTFIGIGYPLGTGILKRFQLDSCATKFAIVRDFAYLLVDKTPGAMGRGDEAVAEKVAREGRRGRGRLRQGHRRVRTRTCHRTGPRMRWRVVC